MARPVRLKQARNGVNRADAHFVGLTGRHRETPKNPHGLDVVLFRVSAVHNGAYRGPVGELAGIAGGHELVLTAHRFQTGEPFKGSPGRLHSSVVRVTSFSLTSPVCLSLSFIVVSKGTISSSK